MRSRYLPAVRTKVCNLALKVSRSSLPKIMLRRSMYGYAKNPFPPGVTVKPSVTPLRDSKSTTVSLTSPYGYAYAWLGQREALADDVDRRIDLAAQPLAIFGVVFVGETAA